MDKKVALSVIMPVYNAEKHLKSSVKSVQNQTLTDIEIILVDDGSTDGSGALCDKIAKEDKRIVVIHKENGGVGSARNAGLKVAHGEYVGFVDSDDWIDNEMFKVMYELLVQHDLDVIRCNTVVHKNGNQNVSWIPQSLCNRVLDRKIVRERIIPMLIAPENEGKYNERLIQTCWCCVFRKKLLTDNAITFSDLISGEDALFVMTAMWKAEKTMLIENALYHYVMQNFGSLTVSLKRLQDYDTRERSWAMILSIVDDAAVLPIFLKRLEQSARRRVYLDIRLATVYNPKENAKEKIRLIKKIVHDPHTVEAFAKPYQGKLPFKMAILYYLIKHKCSVLLYFLVSVNGQ